LFIFDALAKQFESLLNALAKRNRKETMRFYYKKVEDRYLHGTPLAVLEKRKECDAFKIPDKLFVRKSFFDS